MRFVLPVLIAVSIGMPLWQAWRVARLNEPARAGWLLVVADATVFVALVLLLARWDVAGIVTPFVLGAVFSLALLRSWRRHAGRPWRGAGDTPWWRPHLGTGLSFAFFAAALGYVVAGLLPPAAARDVALPLAEGRFIVGQGGGNRLLNHHAGHRAQHHAVDILALGPLGFRARGVLPADNAAYAIFGATVTSPCAGQVVAAHDGLPDLTPPERDPDEPRGNHVRILCDDMLIDLAHLREGSIGVRRGDAVATGERIAEVGNSGNTTEPHLHVHAVDVRTGAPIALRFDGRHAVRNRVFAAP